MGLALGAGGIEAPASPEHCLFNLARDNGPDFTKVLADGFNLEGRAQQELEVAFEVAGRLTWFRLIKPGTYEVIDVDLGVSLTVPIHAAVALLHPVRIPGNLVVDELPAVGSGD